MNETTACAGRLFRRAQETVKTGIAQKASRRIRNAAWNPGGKHRRFDFSHRQGRELGGRSICRQRLVVCELPMIVGNFEIRQVEADALNAHHRLAGPQPNADHHARLEFVEKAFGFVGNLVERYRQQPADDRHFRDAAAVECVGDVGCRIAAAAGVGCEASDQGWMHAHHLPRMNLFASWAKLPIVPNPYPPAPTATCFWALSRT
jgi:hypothetical protein